MTHFQLITVLNIWNIGHLRNLPKNRAKLRFIKEFAHDFAFGEDYCLYNYRRSFADQGKNIYFRFLEVSV